MSLLQRTRLVLDANLNALAERARNPEKLLRLYAREITDLQAALERHRGDIETEIARLDDLPEPAPGESAERAELEVRLAGLAEQQARLADRLGQVRGRLIALRHEATAEPPAEKPKTPPPQDSQTGFDHAVAKFEARHLRFEHWMRRLDGR